MVSSDERAALMAVTCPHCGSAPGEACVVPHARTRASEHGKRHRNLPGPSTLEAGCHDARWRLALGRSALVRVEVLQDLVGHPVGEPRPLATAGAGGERPW